MARAGTQFGRCAINASRWSGLRRLGTMRRSAKTVIAIMDVIFQAGKRSMMVQISKVWGAA
jgi:hypothetical protein